MNQFWDTSALTNLTTTCFRMSEEAFWLKLPIFGTTIFGIFFFRDPFRVSADGIILASKTTSLRHFYLNVNLHLNNDFLTNSVNTKVS